jgi:hypothetical protein
MSASGLVREAFVLFERGTMPLLDAVDGIFIAALQCRELDFRATGANQVSVTVDGHEHFVVRLPHETHSTFRTMLARVGAICGYAEGTMEGNGEMERKEIEYVKAITRPKPGAPLYLVDADLDVRQPDGTKAQLHVVMQNSGRDLFLRIENRNNCEP